MTEPVGRWVVYIIRTTGGKLYTGITTDLKRRYKEHCSGVRGARFFRYDRPEAVVYQEFALNRSEATCREIAIKKMSRAAKLELTLRQDPGPLAEPDGQILQA